VPETARLEEVLVAATARLRAAGFPEPRRETIRIWEGLPGAEPGSAFLSRERPVSASMARRLEDAVARRAAGEPLAHVTGSTGFRRLMLRSDARALIPRPETEGLVDLVLSRASEGLAVDVGTGTGCVALSLAAEGDRLRVVGVDISSSALELAAENRSHLGIPIELVRGDLCEPIGDGTVRVLVSNPPYLTEAEYEELDDSVRAWEPRRALVSGVDGLDATRRLLRDGLRVVEPGGWIALELDCRRAPSAARAATQTGWAEVTIHDDLFGRARYLLAQRSEAP
jgi:release factor glutamine methyltransferase